MLNIDEELNNIYENIDLKMEEIGILDNIIDEKSNISSSEAIYTKSKGIFIKIFLLIKKLIIWRKKRKLRHK